jgi:hypothetical protein
MAADVDAWSNGFDPQAVGRAIEPAALSDGVCLTHDERVRFNELARGILDVNTAALPAVALENPDELASPPKASWWRRRWGRARGMPDVW